MPLYKRLAEDERHLRRTAADALEVLRHQAGFQDADRAIMDVGLLRLPSGDSVGLVQIVFKSVASEKISCVSLPTSTHFSAIPRDLPARRRFDIARLHGAAVDGQGHVQLTDGTRLRAVEMEPARLPVEPSPLDWRIVHLTLELIDARHCYRSLREDLPIEQHALVPDLHFLDAGRLSNLSMPPLKDIAGFVERKYKKVSGQQIANSLRKFGIRFPQRRAQ